MSTTRERAVEAEPGGPGLGIRRGGDRRQVPEKGDPSPAGERRQVDRRRKAGGLMVAMMVLGGGGIGQMRRSAPSAPSAPPDPVAAVITVLDKDRMYDHIILEAAATYGVDPELIRAVIKAESGFDAEARSAAGAEGLMQLMPFLSRELGVKDPFDPRDNIFGGTRYLSRLLERNDGDLSLAVASYNAGPRAVKRYKGIPPYKETRGYVKKIKSIMADAQEAEAGPIQVALAD